MCLLDIVSGRAFFSSGPHKASTAGMNAGTGRIILFVIWVLQVAHALDLFYLLVSFCNWFPLLFGLFQLACTGLSSVGFSLLDCSRLFCLLLVARLLLLHTSFHGFEQFVSVFAHFVKRSLSDSGKRMTDGMNSRNGTKALLSSAAYTGILW